VLVVTRRDDTKAERLTGERERLEQERSGQPSTRRRRDSGFMARVRHLVRRDRRV
jgi:hypothetical protein